MKTLLMRASTILCVLLFVLTAFVVVANGAVAKPIEYLDLRVSSISCVDPKSGATITTVSSGSPFTVRAYIYLSTSEGSVGNIYARILIDGVAVSDQGPFTLNPNTGRYCDWTNQIVVGIGTHTVTVNVNPDKTIYEFLSSSGDPYANNVKSTTLNANRPAPDGKTLETALPYNFMTQLPDDVMVTRASSPTGNGEISFSVVVDSIQKIADPTNPYYSVKLGVMAQANTWGKLGYTVGTPYSWTLPIWPTNYYCNLKDEEGIALKFPYDPSLGPFCFDYFGVFYDSLFISSNGFIAFGQPYIGTPTTDTKTAPRTTDTAWTRPTPDATWPTQTQPNGVIAPFWANLDPTPADASVQAGYIRISELDKGHTFCFAVAWSNVHLAGTTTDETFLVLLWNNNDISFVYHSMKLASTYSAGIENQHGSMGYAVTPQASGKRIDFTPAAGNKWFIRNINITATKEAVTYNQDGTVTVGSDLDAETIVQGVYERTPEPGKTLWKWGGLNLEPYPSYVPPPSTSNSPFSTFWGQIGMLALFTIAGALCPPSLPWLAFAITAADYMTSYAQILGDFTAANRVPGDILGVQNATLANGKDVAFAFNHAKDALAYSMPHNVMSAPLFEWRIYYGGSGHPTTMSRDHNIRFETKITLYDDKGATSTFSAGPLKLKIDRQRMQVLSDNFNDGNLAGLVVKDQFDTTKAWTKETGGAGATAGQVRFTADPYAKQILSDTFSNNPLKDWIIVDSGGPVTVDATQGYSDKPSLKLYKKTTLGGTQARQYFPQQTGDKWGHVIAEAAMRTDIVAGPSDWKAVAFNLYNGDYLETYFIWKDGQMIYVDLKGNHNSIATYVANQWYLVKFDVNLSKGTYDIYVDNVLKKKDAPLVYKGVQHMVDNVIFQAGSVNDLYDDTLWVDDFKLYRDQCVYLSFSGANYARMKSPDLWASLSINNVLQPYSIYLNFMFIPSKNMKIIVADDGRIQIYVRSPAAGTYSLYANSNGVETKVADISPGVWHHITVKVAPGSGYWVDLDLAQDGRGSGPYSLRSYTTPDYRLTFGDVASPTTETGTAYWDDIIIGGLQS